MKDKEEEPIQDLGPKEDAKGGGLFSGPLGAQSQNPGEGDGLVGDEIGDWAKPGSEQINQSDLR